MIPPARRLRLSTAAGGRRWFCGGPSILDNLADVGPFRRNACMMSGSRSFDVFAAGVVGTELRAFIWVHESLEQGAEIDSWPFDPNSGRPRDVDGYFDIPYQLQRNTRPGIYQMLSIRGGNEIVSSRSF
jgi:hypothetical protein